MRTLCLVPKCPLPADSGARQRMFHLMRALNSLGPIDVVAVEPLSDQDRVDMAASFGGARSWSPAHLAPRPGGRLRWLTEHRLPLRLALVDRGPTIAGFTDFVDAAPEPYDLVWSYTAPPAWLFRPSVGRTPLVIDFADVRHAALDREIGAARSRPDRRHPSAAKDRMRLQIDRRRWKRFEHDEGERADLMTVCSAVDLALHDVEHAVIVANGYERPARPPGHGPPGEAPVLLLVGQMTYGPNADGAVWFADDVLPLVRRQLPRATFVIAGRPTPEVESLAGRPGVEVRGHVPDVDDELGRADVVVVPLRQGSGTRIKILEAWAHGVPVVTTGIGAEGLDVIDGRDAIVADDPAAFAAAISRVVGDQALRNGLIAAGRARFDDGYDWRTIEADFADRVRTLVAASTRP
jgi:glycosyltransferase involved in cell wall biosynthesis